MKLRGKEIIEEFCKKHADVTDAMEQWVKAVESTQWKMHHNLKASFPSADYVGENRYVFDIKGNNYRLIAVVVFAAGKVTVRYLGTHAEYDKIKNIKTI